VQRHPATTSSASTQRGLAQTQPILVNTLKELQELSRISSRKMLKMLVGFSGKSDQEKQNNKELQQKRKRPAGRL